MARPLKTSIVKLIDIFRNAYLSNFEANLIQEHKNMMFENFEDMETYRNGNFTFTIAGAQIIVKINLRISLEFPFFNSFSRMGPRKIYFMLL